MKIVFKKQKNKPPTLHITRSDDTETWMSFKHNFIQHDLMHYAAETILDWQDGFYGLVEKGIDIQDFELENREKRPNLPLPAIQMEFIVNLLETEIYQGNPVENFNEQLKKNCIGGGQPSPEFILEEKLNEIRKKFKELNQEWHAVELGENLILDW